MQAKLQEIKKPFGFGFMRLPMQDGAPDEAQICAMVDAFLDGGFDYFDTAHGYMDGSSEALLRACLTRRHPRERYLLADKLSGNFFETQAEIRPLFDTQLTACGVDYFDFYLMHAQSAESFEKFKRCAAYETAFSLQDEGKIRHVGLSFHDTADVLDRILTAYPAVEFVQLQFNYLDYDDPAVQARLCYEVCRKHEKPVMVMEPVKGGSLANLPAPAQALVNDLDSGSAASLALRYAAGFDGVVMVLSGMSSLAQMEENIRFMRDFTPLTDAEHAAIARICTVFKAQDLIACTACRYCVADCPQGIKIPDLFACLNAKRAHQDWNADFYYNSVHTAQGGKASDCIACGKCEQICPQHLEIRALLQSVAAEFEKK